MKKNYQAKFTESDRTSFVVFIEYKKPNVAVNKNKH